VTKFALWLSIGIVGLTASPVQAQQSTGAGRIKVVSGAAFIVRTGETVPAQAGWMVYETDSLKTGADGRIGITLRDDTRLSLGPDSEVRLDRFQYAQPDGRLGLVLNFVRGIAVYVSGRLAKLAPDAIRLETPAAIIGVRGTTLAIRVTPS
jgi:hypothetical protein